MFFIRNQNHRVVVDHIETLWSHDQFCTLALDVYGSDAGGLTRGVFRRYASAFHYLSASINLKPDFPSSYMYLGITLRCVGTHDGAQAYKHML